MWHESADPQRRRTVPTLLHRQECLCYANLTLAANEAHGVRYTGVFASGAIVSAAAIGVGAQFNLLDQGREHPQGSKIKIAIACNRVPLDFPIFRTLASVLRPDEPP